MNVSQLIELLKTFDPQLTVLKGEYDLIWGEFYVTPLDSEFIEEVTRYYAVEDDLWEMDQDPGYLPKRVVVI